MTSGGRPWGLARAVTGPCVVTVTALLFLLVGCSGGSGEGGVSLTFRLEPRPPSVGTANIEVRLVDPKGQPVTGAEISIEANMNHAGMTPTFAELTETGSGPYTGKIEFTMAGDWFLLLEARLADGTRVERTLQVPGVAPAS